MQLVGVEIDLQESWPFGDLARDQRFGKRVLDVPLQRAAQRTRPVERIEALFGEFVLCRFRDLQRDVPFAERLFRVFQQKRDDLRDLLPVQGMEDDDLVDSVDQLRSQMASKLLRDPCLHLLVAHLGFDRGGVGGDRFDQMRADVAGHQDHRILEVHDATLTVGQPSVIKDLQQDIVDIRMRLLDLVEQNDAVRSPTNGFG